MSMMRSFSTRFTGLRKPEKKKGRSKEGLFRPETALPEPANSALPDYENYRMSPREALPVVLLCLGMLSAAALLCYNSLFALIFLSPYLVYFLKKKTRSKKEARKWELDLQFADAIRSLSAALEAGYSVENGIAEAYRDLSVTYEADALIMRELKSLMTEVKNSVPVEEAFAGLAARSGIDDIAGFADVFATAQRTGGNIIAIIRSTTDMIRTRIELKRDIKTAMSAAKYESDIMKCVPFGVLLYLRVFSPGMISALYGNFTGIVFMTVVLVLYALLCELSERLVRIEI